MRHGKIDVAFFLCIIRATTSRDFPFIIEIIAKIILITILHNKTDQQTLLLVVLLVTTKLVTGQNIMAFEFLNKLT